MAQHTGVSKSTVQRWFDLFGVQPHRQRHFKISNDPFFVEKVRDIVGFYLNPPDWSEGAARYTERELARWREAPSPRPRFGRGAAARFARVAGVVALNSTAPTCAGKARWPDTRRLNRSSP